MIYNVERNSEKTNVQNNRELLPYTHTHTHLNNKFNTFSLVTLEI